MAQQIVCFPVNQSSEDRLVLGIRRGEEPAEQEEQGQRDRHPSRDRQDRAVSWVPWDFLPVDLVTAKGEETHDDVQRHRTGVGEVFHQSCCPNAPHPGPQCRDGGCGAEGTGIEPLQCEGVTPGQCGGEEEYQRDQPASLARQ